MLSLIPRASAHAVGWISPSAFSDGPDRSVYDTYMRLYFDFATNMKRTKPRSLDTKGASVRPVRAVGMSEPSGDDDEGSFAILATARLAPALARIKAHTLVIHGRSDLSSSLNRATSRRRYPGALVEVVDAKHFPFDDAPEAVAALLTLLSVVSSAGWPLWRRGDATPVQQNAKPRELIPPECREIVLARIE